MYVGRARCALCQSTLTIDYAVISFDQYRHRTHLRANLSQSRACKPTVYNPFFGDRVVIRVYSKVARSNYEIMTTLPSISRSAAAENRRRYWITSAA